MLAPDSIPNTFATATMTVALLISSIAPCAADDFSGRFVATHNLWRGKAGVASLKWSNELADFAQSWASHLQQTNACGMKHRSGSERMLTGKVTGENLAWKWQAPKTDSTFLYTPEEVVNAWGSEFEFYNHKSGKCNGGMCGHYTQLVWHNTTEVGCGRASCGEAEVWVCNYLPAGNYIGEKPY